MKFYEMYLVFIAIMNERLGIQEGHKVLTEFF